MRLALAAHGRFHAFDFARELARQCHDVTLITNYPRSYVESWGVPGKAIESFPLHGVSTRLAGRLASASTRRWTERVLHEWFGRHTERRLRDRQWDAVIGWSGICEEAFARRTFTGIRVCHRSSAHIQQQDRLLAEEGSRSGLPIERPTPWMIAREQREYQLADLILVPSSFAARTFAEAGVPESKLRIVPLGVDTSMFRPSAEVVDARKQRILEGARLQVAYVGTLSLRKGLQDLITVAKALGNIMDFHCTGEPGPDSKSLMPQLRELVAVHPARPQSQLPETYSHADLFFFPTIEDGFGMVVSQALAAGLPVVCSANSCGPDVIVDGVTGWVVPARAVDQMIAHLTKCHANRDMTVRIVDEVYNRYSIWTWADATASLTKQISATVN